MKVVHIATTDIMGGAARAAYRLHIGLRRLGHESLMYVQYRGSDDPTVIRFNPSLTRLSRMARRFRERAIARDFARYALDRPQGYDLFTDDRTCHGAEWSDQLPHADIIQLHWVAGFLDYHRCFSRFPADLPVVWRLADMNPFTGGCHFDHDCGKFAGGCGACPQLGSSDPNDLSHAIWQRKRGALGPDNPIRLHIVVLNRVMVETVKSSPILGRFPVTVIPNGLDTEVFAPRDRVVSRDLLGVPLDAKVILFGADQVQNRRKGLQFVVESLKLLGKVRDLFVLSVGGGCPDLPSEINQRHLGRVHDDLLLSMIYSAADVLMFPSLQETFGQIALESMACGTPVIGFDGVGGIPELIPDNTTGRSVPLGNATAMGIAVRDLLEDPAERAKMSVKCRQFVLEHHSLDLQAQNYVQLYEGLLQGSGIVSLETGRETRNGHLLVAD